MNTVICDACPVLIAEGRYSSCKLGYSPECVFLDENGNKIKEIHEGGIIFRGSGYHCIAKDCKLIEIKLENETYRPHHKLVKGKLFK